MMGLTPEQQRLVEIGLRLKQAVDEMFEDEPVVSDHDIVHAWAYRLYGHQVQDPERDIVVTNVRRTDDCLSGDAAVRLHTPVEHVVVEFSLPVPPEEMHE